MYYKHYNLRKKKDDVLYGIPLTDEEIKQFKKDNYDIKKLKVKNI